jgi:hypothetical protein
MPLNSAIAINARRQAPSALASSELAGCGRSGPIDWLMEASYLQRASQPQGVAIGSETYTGWRRSFGRRTAAPNPDNILLITGSLGQVHGR